MREKPWQSARLILTATALPSIPNAAMGAAAFTGLLLLGCGPLAAVFAVCLMRRSFLVLLALGRWEGEAGAGS